MRISARAKEETRQRILDTARRRFAAAGFEASSTRDLAAAAGIAAGTLFNYFASKEALAMTLVVEALERGREAFFARRRGTESLEEDLFAHVASGLRELEPYRHFLGEVIETALSPFSRASAAREGTGEGEDVRVRHLETVAELLQQHGARSQPGFVSMHLYWTLYLGVLAFWSRDDSPKQEDTLVVLDESLRLFVASLSLEPGGGEPEESDGSQDR